MFQKLRGEELMVGYTGDILTETTADLAIGLMLCLGRRLVEADKYLRKGKWKYGWNPDLMIGRDLHHKTLGVIGLGKIGSAICRTSNWIWNENIIYKKEF